ncbi:hypothetical protein L1987_83146 [Smallanthus sonchifolius]|uniref:Uncharacterized protein n=1 Tax=Smallanthus sonchifolius TaxID=185202 RepID=A0ACB8YAY3_9ASTR|nr:hypothetical protein L1987_83146 [Smallanthus sonchifolius]
MADDSDLLCRSPADGRLEEQLFNIERHISDNLKRKRGCIRFVSKVGLYFIMVVYNANKFMKLVDQKKDLHNRLIYDTNKYEGKPKKMPTTKVALNFFDVGNSSTTSTVS